VAFEIYVAGVVQGVGFRFFTAQQARDVGVFGNVRNLSDGRVYIEVEGDSKNVIRFISWCQTGPPSATVHSLDYKEVAPKGESGFEIIR